MKCRINYRIDAELREHLFQAAHKAGMYETEYIEQLLRKDKEEQQEEIQQNDWLTAKQYKPKKEEKV